ncbi:MAG: hypothetical protein K1W27_18470 [Lachnospiraceae bacterium]|nr:hypothetical protein C804_00133 [Lachnospiraceae bacterium A4]
MENRMTWEEIQKKYPDQWVGLVDVEWCPDNTATVKSAVIKYTDKSKDELTIMMLRGEIDARYTTPDNFFQLGMIGAYGNLYKVTIQVGDLMYPNMHILIGEELGVQDEKSKFFRNTAFIACRGVLPAGISRREEAKAGIGRGTK